MSVYDDFWNKYLPDATPGLLNLGAGIYTRNLANKEAQQRLATAQGPTYQAATTGATNLLTAANATDPNAIAAERFKAQQALVDPVQARQEAQLMTALRAKGMLGAGVYNPGIAGYTPQPGVPVNPALAAFYAAQAGQRSQDAYNALNEGVNYQNNLVNRAATMNSIAGGAQNTGMQAQGALPSNAANTAALLKGGLGVLKDTGLLQKIPGMLSSGIDWLGTQTGLWNQPDLSSFGNMDFGNSDLSWV